MARLLRVVPRPLRARLKRAVFEIVERGDRLLHGRGNLVPPRAIQYVGGKEQFLDAGREFLGIFRDVAGLQPHESVLDVGCGIGRMAIPLGGYLAPTARYEGFDIVPHAIAWCQRRIHARHPNFQFRQSDVRNASYHPRGAVSAARYVFPYEPHTFDFVFATSLFTHLLPDDAENYLAQIARALKPGGRCLVTWFLLDQASRDLAAEGRSAIGFRHAGPGYCTANPDAPEDALARDEADVRALYARHGLALEEPIRYGTWSGRPGGLSFQDIVLARAPGPAGHVMTRGA